MSLTCCRCLFAVGACVTGHVVQAGGADIDLFGGWPENLQTHFSNMFLISDSELILRCRSRRGQGGKDRGEIQAAMMIG